LPRFWPENTPFLPETLSFSSFLSVAFCRFRRTRAFFRCLNPTALSTLAQTSNAIAARSFVGSISRSADAFRELGLDIQAG
jgi:hypothetical protein